MEEATELKVVQQDIKSKLESQLDWLERRMEADEKSFETL